MLIKWWFISTILFLHFPGFSQLNQKNRLEISIDSEFESFDIVPANKYGFLLHRLLLDHENTQLELRCVDTTFQIQWTGSIPLDRSMAVGKQIVFNNSVYFVLYPKTYTTRNFQICKVDLQQSSYIKYEVKNSIPFAPFMFEVTQTGALIGGYYNQVPVVLFFDFNSQKSKVLPGLFNEPGELNQIKTNKDNSFNVLIRSGNFQNQQTIWSKNYDGDGRLVSNIMLTPEGTNHLIFGKTVDNNENEQIIAGIYGNKTGEYSRGLFIARIDKQGSQQVQYYAFGDLENFFKYMKPNREKRVKERVQRKHDKGKKIGLRYHFLVHELVPYNNQFIFLGEVFVRKYRTISTPGTGTLLTPTQHVFDGYQYTHAAVLGIGPTGTLLWDNSFEINDVKTFTLDQFVKIDPQPDKIVLIYLFKDKIRTKIIRDSTVLEGKSSSEIQLSSSEFLIDKSSSDINKLDYWYDNYFLAYGVQDIESASPNFRRRQKVFFVNKISYR